MSGRDSKVGWRFSEGKLKGKTVEQATQEAIRMWQKMNPAQRDQYAQGAGINLLAPSERAAYEEERQTRRGGYSGPSPTRRPTAPARPQPAAPVAGAQSPGNQFQALTMGPAIAPSNAGPMVGADTPRPAQNAAMDPAALGASMGGQAGAAFAGPVPPKPGLADLRMADEARLAGKPEPVMPQTPVVAQPVNPVAASPAPVADAPAAPANPNEYLGPTPPGPGYTLTGMRGGKRVYTKTASDPALVASQQQIEAGQRRAQAAQEDSMELGYTPDMGWVPKAKPVTNGDEKISFSQYDEARTRRKSAGSTAAQDKKDFALEMEFDRQQRAKQKPATAESRSKRIMAGLNAY